MFPSLIDRVISDYCWACDKKDIVHGEPRDRVLQYSGNIIWIRTPQYEIVAKDCDTGEVIRFDQDRAYHVGASVMDSLGRLYIEHDGRITRFCARDKSYKEVGFYIFPYSVSLSFSEYEEEIHAIVKTSYCPEEQYTHSIKTGHKSAEKKSHYNSESSDSPDRSRDGKWELDTSADNILPMIECRQNTGVGFFVGPEEDTYYFDFYDVYWSCDSRSLILGGCRRGEPHKNRYANQFLARVLSLTINAGILRRRWVRCPRSVL